ncbi:MAG: nucleoside-diphosphate sugar epimerase/dehydratase [Clostridiaceae bacterium]
MVKLRKYKNPFILILADIVILIGAYLVSTYLRFEFSFPKGLVARYGLMILFVALCYMTIFYFFKLYSTLWSVAGYYDYLSIIKANLLSTFVVLAVNMFAGHQGPYSIIIISSFLVLLSTLGVRAFFRAYRRFKCEQEVAEKSNCKDIRNVLIIGAGDAASIILNDIRKHSELKMNIVGLVDDDDFKQNSCVSGFKVLGKSDDLPELVKKLNVDEIIMAIPSCTSKDRLRLLRLAHTTGAKLKTLPGIYEMVDNGININSIRDVDIEDLMGRKEIVLNNELISEYIRGKVILVTGGGGSIGSELCRQIAPLKPKRLIILDIYENTAYEIQNELKKIYPELNLQVIIASVRDKRKMDILFRQQRPQVVFHAAAHKHVPLMEDNVDEAIKNNVFGTLNLALAAKIHKVERFILISTDKAVNPTNIMGATKRLCEMIIQSINSETDDTDYVAVRFGNVFGSNGSVVPLFKKQIEYGGPVTVTHKEITRFFMTIPEAVQLVLQAGSYAKGGEIYVLDMGEPVKIYDMAENLIRLYGYTPNQDIDIEIVGLRPGEKLFEELLMAEEGLESTANKLIFVGRPNGIENERLKEQLRNLNIAINEGDETMNQLKMMMMNIVSTYSPEIKL